MANLAVRVACCNLAVFGMVGGNLALITPIPNAAMQNLESRIQVQRQLQARRFPPPHHARLHKHTRPR